MNVTMGYQYHIGVEIHLRISTTKNVALSAYSYRLIYEGQRSQGLNLFSFDWVNSRIEITRSFAGGSTLPGGITASLLSLIRLRFAWIRYVASWLRFGFVALSSGVKLRFAENLESP